ncbi:DUF721 domain-containing protein [Pelagibacterium xiamenense]|uniref:DUF721 domain-containing protein n=1 Tax=Pelagibacterium xiamenense TaxID=2901140 RepID=UPI001E39C537|nr:DciA family protein [Pelagibacterium xiamenense]MCD7060440.1 DciA family protein [Pelagibacterium xiamenense]
MAKDSSPPKRKNRAVPLGEMIGNALDPALKRRGFASRDLIANWPAIAPVPYDRIAIPDRLAWPRRDKPDPEGAVLYLRCVEGHGLAIAHEGPAIAAAVNRYFGYLVVASVRLSATPFAPEEGKKESRERPLPAEKRAQLDATVAPVEDENLRSALERLGRGILGRKGK